MANNKNNKQNEEEKKGSGVWITSICTFLIIATLQSCNEAKVKREVESKDLFGELPRIVLLQPKEENQKPNYEIYYDNAEEEIEEEVSQFHK